MKGPIRGMERDILNFYTQPGVMTATGKFEPKFEELPLDIEELARTIQGLLLHEHVASNYGVTLTEDRCLESHLRSVGPMLECLLHHDSSSLSRHRPLEKRLVGTCRNFSVILVAMLREKGVPARARCGFATYFIPDFFVDHWVCEYWNAEQERWILVDAQLDELQRKLFATDFETLDVPRDHFIGAGEAWAMCRRGAADPTQFGIVDMNGLWFIAGNVIRDLASLNNWEMLPWDAWGAMPGPSDTLNNEQLGLLDWIAEVTRNPDSSFNELRELYQDERLRVPETVFNCVLNRPEFVSMI